MTPTTLVLLSLGVGFAAGVAVVWEAANETVREIRIELAALQCRFSLN